MPRDETVIDIRPTRAMLAYTETTSPTRTGRSSLRLSRCRRAQNRRDRERRRSRAGQSDLHRERVNAPFLAAGGSGEDFRAGIERAMALGWLWLHESGTYVKFTDAGAALFA